MTYKLHTSLDTRKCQEKLRDTLISDFNYGLWGGIGYFGDVDEFDKSFWIWNKTDVYCNNKGGYRICATRKLIGELYGDKEGTGIVCEFKLLTIYKVFWGIWYFFLTLLFLFCIYNFLISYIMYDKFQIAFLSACFIIMIFGILGGFCMKYNIDKGRKAEENTIEFLEGLLKTNKAQCDDF